MSLNSNIIWLSARWRSPCWRFYPFRINASHSIQCSEHKWPAYCSRALTSKLLRALLFIFVWASILLKLLFNKWFTAIWSCIFISVCIFWLHQQQLECLVLGHCHAVTPFFGVFAEGRGLYVEHGSVLWPLYLKVVLCPQQKNTPKA